MQKRTPQGTTPQRATTETRRSQTRQRYQLRPLGLMCREEHVEYVQDIGVQVQEAPNLKQEKSPIFSHVLISVSAHCPKKTFLDIWPHRLQTTARNLKKTKTPCVKLTNGSPQIKHEHGRMTTPKAAATLHAMRCCPRSNSTLHSFACWFGHISQCSQRLRSLHISGCSLRCNRC